MRLWCSLILLILLPISIFGEDFELAKSKKTLKEMMTGSFDSLKIDKKIDDIKESLDIGRFFRKSNYYFTQTCIWNNISNNPV